MRRGLDFPTRHAVVLGLSLLDLHSVPMDFRSPNSLPYFDSADENSYGGTPYCKFSSVDLPEQSYSSN